jgi:hypothetical protein
MQIICDTTFLDGRDRFEQGEKRTVQPTDTETSEQRAARFIGNGWAHEAGTEPAAADGAATSTDITAHSAAHKVKGA